MLVSYYKIEHPSVLEINFDLYDFYEYDNLYKKVIDACNQSIAYYESHNNLWASIIINAFINAYGINRNYIALNKLSVNLISTTHFETGHNGIVNPNDWVSSVNWCIDNFKPYEFLIIESASTGGNRMNVYFKYKIDMMAFKLRWA